MISVPTYRDVEMRVLRVVLTRPWLLPDVAELEPTDFDEPSNRLLWTAIRNVEVAGVPGSGAEILTACAEWLLDQPGAARMNRYGMLAAELLGDVSHVMREQAPTLDPRVLREDDPLSTDTRTRASLKNDATTLRFSRRAREQMREQQDAAVRRRQH